jgi:transposase-like protein
MGLLSKGGTTVMKKHGTKSTVAEPPIVSLTPASVGQITLPRLALDTRQRLREFVLLAGMEALAREMEDDRTLLCGPKGAFQDDRRAYRHGHDVGTLVLGGRKVRMPKPRVRSVEGDELELPHWRLFSHEDPLDERMQEQILVGVSTRKYARSLEPLPASLKETGIRRSSVSRRFVARTTRIVEEFLGRSLEEIDLPVILLDGIHLGDHVLVVALGIDITGKKHVLGVVEGTTESEEVCKSLLRNLINRGLRVERARLFVIDGGKGLRKAIRTVFGEWALVQRCQVHKARNVLEHLPERQRVWVRASLMRAWSAPTVGRARDLLRTLAGKLYGDHPGAANSIEEGLDETLTLIRLGLVGALHRSLRSTNPIENLQGSIRRVTRNVKRWKGGSMALRWTVSAVLDAEKSFRRLKGHRDMPRFVAALEAALGGKAVDREAQIA